MKRRAFLKGAAGLFVPAMPALILPSSARAQLNGGMMFPGPGTPASGGGGGFSLVYQSSATNTNGATTFNFPLTWGSNTRLIVALGYLQNNPSTSITSVTIGGVAATQVTGSAINRGAFGGSIELWESNSSVSGTSGNVTVVYSNNPNSFSAPSSAVLYALTTTTPTAGTAVGGTISSVTSKTLSGIVVLSGGNGIIACYFENSVSTTATNATIDVFGTSAFTPAGHFTATGTISSTLSFGTTSGVAVAVPWGP